MPGHAHHSEACIPMLHAAEFPAAVKSTLVGPCPLLLAWHMLAKQTFSTPI